MTRIGDSFTSEGRVDLSDSITQQYLFAGFVLALGLMTIGEID